MSPSAKSPPMKTLRIFLFLLLAAARAFAWDAHNPTYPGVKLTGSDGLRTAAVSGTDGNPAIALPGAGVVSLPGTLKVGSANVGSLLGTAVRNYALEAAQGIDSRIAGK